MRLSTSSTAVISAATAQRQHQADDQGRERAPREHGAAEHERDAGRGHREDVGADRHRPDDQDPVAVDDAERGDDAGNAHEHEVAGQQPRVGARLAEEVGPDDVAERVRGRGGPDRVDAQELDVVVVDTEMPHRRQRGIGGALAADVRGDQGRAARALAGRAHHVARAGQGRQARRHVGHLVGRAVGADLQHALKRRGRVGRDAERRAREADRLGYIRWVIGRWRSARWGFPAAATSLPSTA